MALEASVAVLVEDMTSRFPVFNSHFRVTWYRLRDFLWTVKKLSSITLNGLLYRPGLYLSTQGAVMSRIALIGASGEVGSRLFDLSAPRPPLDRVVNGLPAADHRGDPGEGRRLPPDG